MNAIPMTLGEKQRLFVRLENQWVQWVLAQGYELTHGESLRSDEQAEINGMGYANRVRLANMIRPYPAFTALSEAILNNGKAGGIKTSLHMEKLAADWNLFKDGAYIADTLGWREVGEHWETLHPLCRWGGRFGDGNHISLEHNGRK